LSNQIGEKTMTYNKPELVTLANPIKAIQAHLQKPLFNTLDATQDQSDPNYNKINATATAYEADE
jgi:hypothetical protein